MKIFIKPNKLVLRITWKRKCARIAEKVLKKKIRERDLHHQIKKFAVKVIMKQYSIHI